jgi:hypothetical protein
VLLRHSVNFTEVEKSATRLMISLECLIILANLFMLAGFFYFKYLDNLFSCFLRDLLSASNIKIDESLPEKIV